MESSGLHSFGINGEGELRGKPANPGSPGKMEEVYLCNTQSKYTVYRHAHNMCNIKKIAIKHSIAQFAISINSNVCLHIRVLNTLMRESYA